MAAGQTSGDSGLVLEPVEIVVDWARQNSIRRRSEEAQIEYVEFKESYETEGR